MSSFKLVFLLGFAFSSGWFLREWTLPKAGFADAQSPSNHALQSQTAQNERLWPANRQYTSPQSAEPLGRDLNLGRQAGSSLQPSSSNMDRLSSLLKDNQFDAAMRELSRIANLDGDSLYSLRKMFVERMQALLDAGEYAQFDTLAEVYLGRFYRDVGALLMLARANAERDYFWEAIDALLSAHSNAYQLSDLENVKHAVSSFLNAVDRYLEDRQDWYTLSQIYFRLESSGLLPDKVRLRQAEVDILNGDVYSARQHLQYLIDNNVEQVAARQLLTQISDPHQADTPSEKEDMRRDPQRLDYQSTVALTRMGNQYIAKLGVGEGVSVALLLDTGASITTLSPDVFARVQSAVEAEFLGQRLFNTANGVTRGQVYRLAELSFGEYTLTSVAVAVLPENMSKNSDGLLGMNVLGRFQFYIDPDKNQLWLRPRQKTGPKS